MLELGGLYIALYARATPNDYHWAIYHHWSENRGMKFHIRNLGQGWIAEHGPTRDIMKQFLLMGLMKIAVVTYEHSQSLQDIITAVPYNSPNVTCRTWVLDALRHTISSGIVPEFSLEQVEIDAKAFGSSQFDDTARNVQPRPTTTSSVFDQCASLLDLVFVCALILHTSGPCSWRY
ncbi:hypothetical protein CERSUDRAFT_163292 [Gelatoporia subvermispora B]|uniref:Uncharacterized protein n=1 Tax=Ceriporiopsis subvermispora (strain B) TaxID=914234 RepID=M2QXF0_CERS8|nr:hypothetical protein CERSUDRAFT_163292 [Gelatoporia subvermispora B]